MNRLARYALLPLAPLLIAAQDPGEIEIEPVPPPEELRSEAFVAAQYAQISSAAAAVDKVTALKQVLARHPGTAQVHLRLISGERITTLELDQSLRVTPSSALMGDLKELLGPGCLGG